MTQPHNSAHNRLQGLTTKRFASTLPAQSLCWLSSFSLLSGGLVLAQTETSIDNIVPTIENSQPTPAINPIKKYTATPDVARPQPEFSQRRTRLKKKLNREVSQSTQPVRQSQPKIQISEPAAIKRSTPQIETSRVVPVKIREEKPKPEVATSNSSPSLTEKLPVVAQPSNNSNNSVSETAGKTKDYNNAYIDPTDYKAGGTTYIAPDSVVITERSSGCRATLPAGGVSGSLCAKPSQGNQRVADGKPSWLKRSQNSKLATVPVVRPLATTNGWRNPRVAPNSVANNRWGGTAIASSGVTKSTRPNRFIPNPGDFSTTKVSATPIAPSGGALPAPMADGNVAPRPSTVSYDFPIASALPQIPYTGRVAYSGQGMMFPLSIPSPITSLFGWRTHPITGGRRFHAGTDIGAPMGTPILAAAKGQVETANWLGGYGLAVVINHSSAQQTLYGHMSEIFVQPGQWVEPGTMIGRVGSTGNSTGPHLHFEVRHLTPNGWVATDPGVTLDTALSQLVQSLQTAQVAQKPGS
ncbi:MAG: M23 family metallopeptidase [Mojavia pulchra JT2-VF2]|jgi:murein DD-endopeptidase MepM/ murein hydrolase activator NlpD|uniref:M23 family metallopeptidase n=1 Tax=Mojavia pulchra JT2-VF2 TaxID=287848 RepID=A0A951UIP2_9NOST|nr:M23 family metallopeptidase [Mojavia pulchra JT2-VF2]